MEHYCSFCGKSHHEVEMMIASPPGDKEAFICNECINLCSEIITERRLANAKRAGTDVTVLPVTKTKGSD